MRALIPLLVVALLTAPAVAAQNRSDADAVARMMAEAGLSVTRLTDRKGDPMLESQIEGAVFHVNFYDCRPACQAMQFSAGFDLDETMPMEMANLWNRDRRFGRVYLDRTGDPYIEMDIGLAGDGIGRKNFDDALETWRILLQDFREFIDW